ncbi:predicted protein [Plenodomus lingam JN3]|uniref:Predicted protein n=2 Tax=Leptosphaeria maculans TaxID=5022 RepID=E4ZWE3_LEPMJ|nr:predicted protein [Plenodomus lingam JN3]CBX95919.1 predicted protein [Plenodomus lingam JN3]
MPSGYRYVMIILPSNQLGRVTGIDHERVTGIGRCHDYLHQAQIFGTHRLYLWGKHPELFSCNGMIT